MDMRKYSGGIIKPEDLYDGPRRETIVAVSENEKHGCAVLHFESGDQFYCWNNYTRILNKAWGYESENWLEQELECFARTLPRQENRYGKRNRQHTPDLAGKAGSV